MITKLFTVFCFLLIEINLFKIVGSASDSFSHKEEFMNIRKNHSLRKESEEPLGSLRSSGKIAPLSLEKTLPLNGIKQESNVEITHQSVEQENIGNEKRRKFINGRNHAPLNLTIEYVSEKENETWNVEKKKKIVELKTESQHSTCQVTTENLIATAQTTVSRALKDLCHANDLEERFQHLESSLSQQLSTIRSMIKNLEERLEEHAEAVVHGQKKLSSSISKGCQGNGMNGNGGSYSPNHEVNNKNQKSTPGINDDSSDESVSGTRDAEILKFNSSIHMETILNAPPKKVFTYYWKIKDMMQKLSGWNPRKSFRSQSFYIFPSGYRMYMRVFPRQLEENFYVRVGLTKGEFDDSLKWPFPLKHKIHILDQTKEGRLFEDIASRTWDPNLLCSDFNWQKPIKGDNHECTEVGFPHDVLSQREYIRKDTLVIKLTVYLES